MDDRDRELLRHFLGAIAYRTQKAIRGAPEGYWNHCPGHRARTPLQILRHMTSLMGYVGTHFRGGSYPFEPEALPTIGDEVERFHELLRDVGDLLADPARTASLTTEQLLQGPLADAMTHVGQLAYLRRLAASPVPPENFIHARIDAARLGSDQADPAAPDDVWPEAPEEG